MSKKEKLRNRFKSKPLDFSWGELKSMHKPHPTPVLKRYQVEQILEFLKKEGLL